MTAGGGLRLVITGPTGTGKTTVAPLVAARLGLPLVDIDADVEAREGRPVHEIFTTDGEARFRALEQDAVRRAARRTGVVVATGGGAVLDEASFDALARDALVVVLHCAVTEVARRLRGESWKRTLLQGDPAGLEERVAAVHASRAERHAAVGAMLDTTGRAPEEVAEMIVARYRDAAAAAAGPAAGGGDGA